MLQQPQRVHSYRTVSNVALDDYVVVPDKSARGKYHVPVHDALNEILHAELSIALGPDRVGSLDEPADLGSDLERSTEVVETFVPLVHSSNRLVPILRHRDYPFIDTTRPQGNFSSPVVTHSTGQSGACP